MTNDPYNLAVIELNHLIGVVGGLVGIEQDRGKKVYLQICLAKLKEAKSSLDKAGMNVR